MTPLQRNLTATAVLLASGFSLAPSLAAAGPSTAPAAADDYPRLVSQLGHRDPAVRKNAYDKLAQAGEAARSALADAIHSGRPAVATAASELLLRTRWYLPDDPPGVQQRIGRYGLISPKQRWGVLKELAARDDAGFHKAALRVAQQEPVDTVVWNAFAGLALDDSWDAILAGHQGTIPSPVLIARARGIMYERSPDYQERADANSADKITNLLELALGQERDHPTADASQLRWAVKRLVGHYLAAEQPAKAAEKWRLLVGRGEPNVLISDGRPDNVDAANDPDDDDATGLPALTAIQQVLQLQAAAGPLPGLDRDLNAAGDENADRVAVTLAAIAARAGDPLAAHLLVGRLLADQPGESDNDRAERLFNAGQQLFSAGVQGEAQAVFDRIVAMDRPDIERMTDAYLRLSELYARQEENQLAGDSLQRALDHLPPGGGLQLHRGKKIEPWPKEDVMGKIAYYYFTAAKKHGNADEARKQALAAMSSGSTDSDVFLEVLPTLEDPSRPVAEKDAIDAYFDRVYAKATDRLAKSPDDPMEMNDMAWLCSRSNRHLDQAVDLATKAVAARPAESAYIDTLAEAKFRTGHPAEALALEQQAVKLLPENSFMREQIERFKKAAATQPK